MTEPILYGTGLQEARLAAGLSQIELADLADVGRSTVQSLERLATSPPETNRSARRVTRALRGLPHVPAQVKKLEARVERLESAGAA